jgi:hypothetical protein
MSKRIALKDFVAVDGVNLSQFARAVTFSSEHQRIDVSGFNATGTDEFLAGNTVQEVTVEFFGSYGVGEVHATLYPVHAARSIVAFNWRPDQTASISATNPELRGNVQVLSYSPGATRGDVEAFSVTLTAADTSGLAFVSTS